MPLVRGTPPKPPIPVKKTPESVLMPTSKIEPYWKSDCGRVVLYKGDCREVMRSLEEESVMSIVSDPPYGLEFMGKEWDAPWKATGKIVEDPSKCGGFQDGNGGNTYSRSSIKYGAGGSSSKGFQQWFESCASEMIRVSKPGSHILAFGGTRMFHRLVCATEDAGFEIRDVIMWVYGSGFPKSHDVSKAIDAMHGAERKVVGTKKAGMGSGDTFGMLQSEGNNDKAAKAVSITAPATDDAAEWHGWGSALKPAVEPIVVARKPLIGTLAQNTLEHFTGGINIDGCRVGGTGEDVVKTTSRRVSSGSGRYQLQAAPRGTVVSEGGEEFMTKDGRWPANLIHDGSEEVVKLFPESSSSATIQNKLPLRPGDSCPGEDKGTKECEPRVMGYNDSGSAARFFYTAKPNIEERDGNFHPTVKPIDLMMYLIRMVTVKEGIVLDPFLGSGTTGVAAIEEGCRFIGIEQDDKYIDIAVARIRRKLVEKGYAKDSAPKATKLGSK